MNDSFIFSPQDKAHRARPCVHIQHYVDAVYSHTVYGDPIIREVPRIALTPGYDVVRDVVHSSHAVNAMDDEWELPPSLEV